jgi:DNA end-binding protein Ku
MIAIAEMILKPCAGHFDPSTFRDRYQEALRELIEAKIRGLPVKTKPTEMPRPVVSLMDALKRSLAQETGETARKPRRKAIVGSETCCCRSRASTVTGCR